MNRPPINTALTMAQPPDSEAHPVSAKDLATSSGTGPSSMQSMDAYIGKVLDGRYQLEEPIGAGGMGIVFRARHQVIGKKVAIKILRGEMAADHEMTERFLNEARAASSIGNPHIVDISDFGRVDDGSAYFVMEYLEGQALMNLMTSLQIIPVGRIIHIAKQIARALDAAHERGIVHRDLKPDNVMLIQRGDDKDFVKILDFGIAKVGQATSRLTKAGSVFGTPHYMSPEQAAGTEVTYATDVYSLGVILYEMAAGKVPFDADNFMGILTQHMYKSPVYLRTLVPQPQEIPVSLEAIVHKCLAKKPEHRYASMAELVLDLDRADKGQIPNAVEELMSRSGGFNVPADYFRVPERHGGAMIPSTPFHKRKPILMSVIIGACIVCAVIGVVLIALAKKGVLAAQPPIDPTVANGIQNQGQGLPVAPSAAAVVAKKSVPVVTLPEAVANVPVFNGDLNLGPHPVLMIADGETITIRAELTGYKPAVAECKSSMNYCTLKLDRMTERPTWAAPPPTAKTTTKPSSACPPGQELDLFKKCSAPFHP